MVSILQNGDFAANDCIYIISNIADYLNDKLGINHHHEWHQLSTASVYAQKAC